MNFKEVIFVLAYQKMSPTVKLNCPNIPPFSPNEKNLQNTFITELAFNKTYTNKFVKNA